MKYCFLLPAYKARFFEEALGSILAQTYKDFDVIVSDDCSPEDLKSIVDKFADPRVTYRRNEKNIGAEHLVDHWNMLLGMTDAEYIIMASDDDVYDTEFLYQIDKLVAKWPNVNVFRGRMRRINSEGKEIRCEESLMSEWLSYDNAFSMFVTDQIESGIPQYVFRNSVLKTNGGFYWCPAAWYSDDLTVYRMMISNESGIAITKDVVFSFRDSGINISAIQNDKSNIRLKLTAVDYYYKSLHEMLCHIDNGKTYEEAFKTRARSATCDIIEHQGASVFLWGIWQCINLKSKCLSLLWCLGILIRHTYRHFMCKEN